jgi:hypothetical protein
MRKHIENRLLGRLNRKQEADTQLELKLTDCNDENLTELATVCSNLLLFIFLSTALVLNFLSICNFLEAHVKVVQYAHLHIMGLSDGDPTCRFCRMETETVQHIIRCCEALARQRYNVFGKLFAEPTDISTASVRVFCLYIRGTGLLNRCWMECLGLHSKPKAAVNRGHLLTGPREGGGGGTEEGEEDGGKEKKRKEKKRKEKKRKEKKRKEEEDEDEEEKKRKEKKRKKRKRKRKEKKRKEEEDEEEKKRKVR